ncbi:hypothetical protein FisN_33Hh006 [Fistulifera solaris]|uniref:Cyclin-like domain-containing protein n=1 Tax=Fistulifera solaris TaxID=1519565 RepID=A0A1Z5KQY6_FISSO|nr:hypothetical protein FisN_33Hh006 [Fistulifera solaris]|eukprot:GAX28716.1 hypothetical protein FisN_33Hh006 [Fistulifera solaris]
MYSTPATVNRTSMQQVIDTIHALRRQEEHYFVTSSYHYPARGVDWDCRQKMAAWCSQVIQFCDLSHETAETAMVLLDCFLASSGGESARTCRDRYRLACMACLYAAIKSTETQALHSNTFSELSQGAYSVKDLEQMELSILTCLNWRVNPPTSMAFVREMMHLLPPAFGREKKRDIYDLAVLQTERGFGAVVASPSVAAYAALMNSVQIVSKDTHCWAYIAKTMADLLKLDGTSDEMRGIQASFFHFLPKRITFVSSGRYIEGDDRLSNKSASLSGFHSPRSVSE